VDGIESAGFSGTGSICSGRKGRNEEGGESFVIDPKSENKMDDP